MVPYKRTVSPNRMYVGQYHYCPVLNMWNRVIGVTDRGFRIVQADARGRPSGEVRVRPRLEAYLFARRPFAVTAGDLDKVGHPIEKVGHWA